MSDAKFTKGPWLVEKSNASSTGSVHYAVKTAYKPAEHPHSERFIVFMCGGLGDYHPSRQMNDYRSDPQIEADAQLIAAAPDLLAALRACQLQMLQSNNDSEYVREANEMAQAAIAKAEGR